MSTLTVGIRDLKAHLSAYLRRIGAGETLVITDRGKPVGRLVPMEDSHRETLRALEEAGFLSWNGEKLSSRSEPAPENRGNRLASEALLEDRG